MQQTLDPAYVSYLLIKHDNMHHYNSIAPILSDTLGFWIFGTPGTKGKISTVNVMVVTICHGNPSYPPQK